MRLEIAGKLLISPGFNRVNARLACAYFNRFNGFAAWTKPLKRLARQFSSPDHPG